MQTISGYWKIIFFIFFGITSCRKQNQESFDVAIAKKRNTLLDQVSAPRDGLPYFTVETLNPTWDTSNHSQLVTIPKFTLTDHHGQTRDETIFDGKITVVGFMFATCQGFCPFVVEGMKRVEKVADGTVQFVTLTVDPENDTPKVLKKYAEGRKLGKHWVLLTGNKETIYSLAKKTFASQAFQKPTKDPNFIHSEHLYVVGPDRRLRGILNGTRVDVQADAAKIIKQFQAQKKNELKASG